MRQILRHGLNALSDSESSNQMNRRPRKTAFRGNIIMEAPLYRLLFLFQAKYAFVRPEAAMKRDVLRYAALRF
jgi:hypothetical protein